MFPKQYRNFLILLNPADDQHGPETYRFDRSVYFDKYRTGLPDRLDRFDLKHLLSGLDKWRRLRAYPESEWKNVGTLIAQQLLPDQLIGYLREMQRDNLRARLVIKANTGRLRSVPWELAYIESLGFLSLNELISIVRCEHGILREHKEELWTETNSPVEVCFLGPGNALATQPLHPQRARQSIVSSLPGPVSTSNSQSETPPLDLRFTDPISSISSWLSSKSSRTAQVLLFHGHGEASHGIDGAKLLFESFEFSNKPDPVPAERLSSILRTQNLRLAVICACYSGDAQDDSPWRGVATALHKMNVPAVVGLRRANMDNLVESFECGFFQTLAQDRCVESALVSGRRRIHALAKSDFADWAAPVLYMRPQGVPEYWISNERLTHIALQREQFDAIIAQHYRNLKRGDDETMPIIDVLHELFNHYRELEAHAGFTARDHFISQLATRIARSRSAGEVLDQSIY